MIKACIFDLDGTLSDTINTIAYYGNRALSSFGFPEIPTDVYKKLVGNGRDLLIHRMLEFHNADTEENYINVGGKYDEGYENDVMYLTKPYDGTPELLASLKASGIKCAVLSNKPHNVTAPIVELLFGKGVLDLCAGAKEGVPIKPAPDGAFEIANELSLSPDECIFIGDTYVDITTGKNAGMKTIGVLWGFRDEEELQNAGADYIVSSANEIYDIVKGDVKKQPRPHKA